MSAIDTDRALARLYEQIPAFECLPGCTACCGPVPFARREWARLKDKRIARGDSLACPYANPEGGCCDIHAQRPFICRLFGAADGLICPNGAGPDVRLTGEQAEALTIEYKNLIERQ